MDNNGISNIKNVDFKNIKYITLTDNPLNKESIKILEDLKSKGVEVIGRTTFFEEMSILYSFLHLVWERGKAPKDQRVRCSNVYIALATHRRC
ncbi:MAG: hypothetical protein DRR16_23295 [Candidatus Parabeggiatoa sp. nov. 3]|nr:MAG: hypothetical protein DRR00_12645 [Gammaproteobacteria bacterium]RKZ64337.1 MAG: hypothetical protein DRQ99_15660 [Gammaproteobacteria bacterium]RKZ80779.1 MAG: hypothetical protein DRR16_23295 [Gammaproteobacteria bacterium]